MINGAQIRAARALLDWTSRDLAAKANMQPHTVTNFESGKVKAEVATIERMVTALQTAGIEFTSTGVQMVSPLYTFDGDGWYVDLLRDVLKSGAKEIIIQNADNSKSSKAILEMVQAIREAGASIRFAIAEGDTYMVLPVSCYRWLPEKHFKNWVSIIYGDRVAFSVNGNMAGRVLHDADVADSLRRQFDFVWECLQPLNVESTAHERIS